MGWIAINKDGEMLREDVDGRPVAAGEEGTLALIAQEDYGHKIAIDLQRGIILFEYETLGVQNKSIEITGVKYAMYICDDTNIAGDLYDVTHGEPDEEGWYSDTITPITWRPIWFSRVTNGDYTKIIGAQCTMPALYGGRNVKKMVILFSDGRVGIY